MLELFPGHVKGRSMGALFMASNGHVKGTARVGNFSWGAGVTGM
jgi:hypothetical protein